MEAHNGKKGVVNFDRASKELTFTPKSGHCQGAGGEGRRPGKM